jgi:hypothetical protein
MKERFVILLLSRRWLARGLTAVAGLLSTVLALAAWERFHADGANRGFADVATAPAGKRSLSVTDLGTVAPGAGPVVAPDGTIYLGTLQGQLIALHADGSRFWRRDIAKGQAIMASPVVGADGSVYVVGTKQALIRDNRVNPPRTKTVFESTLHTFTSSGGFVGQTPFPKHGGGGFTTASPNIVRVGGAEVVVVPAVYPNPLAASVEVRLIGFSSGGAVVVDRRVTLRRGTVTGGGDLFPAIPFCAILPLGPIVCLICGGPGCDYAPQPASTGPKPPPPVPGVAVFTFAGGGAPFVILNDGFHDIVGYTVSSGPVLTETFRFHDEAQRLISPPMVLADGHTLVGAANGAVVFAGPNQTKLPPVTGLGPVSTAPTLTVNGLVVIVESDRLVLLRGAKVLSSASLPARSFTVAAASRTHVFVSTTDGLVTFDADAQKALLTFPWVGGGMSPPVIGPKGHVYAIASNILFVFPPP